MGDIKRQTIRRSIINKGFKKRRGKGRHDVYCLFHDGKWYTHIKVLLSRGSGHKTYPMALWKRMRILLQLERLEEVQALLECPMSGDEYESILKKKGHI